MDKTPKQPTKDHARQVGGKKSSKQSMKILKEVLMNKI